jgi:methylenetetrahydrofolate reductase (NADPH)
MRGSGGGVLNNRFQRRRDAIAACRDNLGAAVVLTDAKGGSMFECPYVIEILSPKRADGAGDGSLIDRFVERYYRVIDAGMGVSVPDNPMGQPRRGLLELIERNGLPVDPERIVMNLNTFHAKDELDGLLRQAARLGVSRLLVVRGDGGPQLPKLDPHSIGGKKSVVTTVDLLRYIHSRFGNQFLTGVAFNHYNPLPFESDRLDRKIDAGAKFVVTQPVIGKNPAVDALKSRGIPLVVEAWMSKNVKLLFKSVRQPLDERAADFDPAANLETLHAAYPACTLYLSLLGFKRSWRTLLPRFGGGRK